MSARTASRARSDAVVGWSAVSLPEFPEVLEAACERSAHASAHKNGHYPRVATETFCEKALQNSLWPKLYETEVRSLARSSR